MSPVRLSILSLVVLVYYSFCLCQGFATPAGSFLAHPPNLTRKKFASSLVTIRGGKSSDENGLFMKSAEVVTKSLWEKIPQPLKNSGFFAAGVIVGAVVFPAITDNLSLTLYNTAEDIPAAKIRSQQTITGVVAKCTDGDTYRIRHKTLFSDGKFQGKLSENTIVIRIAAVDTPETAKFGKSGQAGGDDATSFAREQLEGKTVSVKMLSRDQYQRVVGMVSYGSGPFKKNISEELLKRGLATVYRQGGAEYGPQGLDFYDKIEKQAQKKKLGIWATEGGETPAEYKKRMKAEGN